MKRENLKKIVKIRNQNVRESADDTGGNDGNDCRRIKETMQKGDFSVQQPGAIRVFAEPGAEGSGRAGEQRGKEKNLLCLGRVFGREAAVQ